MPVILTYQTSSAVLSLPGVEPGPGGASSEPAPASYRAANSVSNRAMTCNPVRVYVAMKAFIWLIVRAMMPYPDLVRRWRVRRAAFALISRASFPADDLVTPGDVAELALLRVLWLQRQTRRAVRSRQREAAVLLARSSMEVAILGLWCLRCPGAVESLRAAQLKSAGTTLVAFVGATGIFPKHLIEQAIRTLGQPKQGRTVRDMAKDIDAATGGGVEAEIYDRWYVPTSTYLCMPTPSRCLGMSGLSRSVPAGLRYRGRTGRRSASPTPTSASWLLPSPIT